MVDIRDHQEALGALVEAQAQTVPVEAREQAVRETPAATKQAQQPLVEAVVQVPLHPHLPPEAREYLHPLPEQALIMPVVVQAVHPAQRQALALVPVLAVDKTLTALMERPILAVAAVAVEVAILAGQMLAVPVVPA